VGEDWQTLRSLLSAGRPDGRSPAAPRLAGWGARGLGRDAGRLARAGLPAGSTPVCWRL